MTIRGTGVGGFAKGKAYVVIDRGERNPYEGIPKGVILVVKTLSLSDSALIDFRNVIGIVCEEPDTSGQVTIIAKGVGVPAVTGIENCTRDIVSGDRLIIQNLDLLINPDLGAVNAFEKIREETSTQLSLNLESKVQS